MCNECHQSWKLWKEISVLLWWTINCDNEDTWFNLQINCKVWTKSTKVHNFEYRLVSVENATLSPSDLVLQLEKHSNLGTDFISNRHTILSKPGFNKETLNLILFQWSDFSFERDLIFNNPNPSLDLVSEWFWAVIWILIKLLEQILFPVYFW